MNANRTIRLFVSSTFSDLKAERDALQREVFPRLKQLCLAKGLRFQAIDLRWGISDEAGRDNKTMRICLRELKRCQQAGPKPNFLILLGDRYGWRPLPETIPAALFLELEKRIGPVNPTSATCPEREPCGQRTMFRRQKIQIDGDIEFRGNQDRFAKLLRSWYRYDENAVPPVYELQPREGRYQELDVWQNEIEQPLLEVMAHKAKVLHCVPVFSTLLRENINTVAIGSSATEQEIIEGALKVPDAATHVRAFFRTIDGLPNPAPNDYVETGEPAKMLRELKDRISEHIGKDNACAYRVPWHTDGIHADDLKDFCEQAWKQLSAIVEQQIAVLTAIPPDEQEKQAHQDFGEERCRHFVGRREPLERIAEYLRQGTGTPLAVVGPSGSGKSAVMAKAVERQAASGKRQEQIIVRYIGATPGSSDLIQLLRNIVGEIRKRYPVQSEGRATISERAAASRENGSPTAGPEAHALPKDAEQKPTDSEIPYEFNPLVNSFHEALQRPTADQPLFVFLDALDQLTASNNAHSLVWLPAKLSDHVRLVVSAASPPESGTGILPVNSQSTDPASLAELRRASPRTEVYHALESRIPAAHRVTLAPLTVADGEQILTNWLADAQRTLQPLQRDTVLAAFAHEGSPLWLRTATEEAARLASWEPAPAFAFTTQGLLGQVLDRLSREEEHGNMLVSRTLSYLACARHGLAEDEILDILSADKEVMADFRRRSPNSPKVDRLPVAVWVRLHGDMAFYLAEHQAQGANLISFYHQSSFCKLVAMTFLNTSEKRRAMHIHLASCFEYMADPRENFSWTGLGKRGVNELPFHLFSAGATVKLADILGDIAFAATKSAGGAVYDLLHDYEMALDCFAAEHGEHLRLVQLSSILHRYAYGINYYPECSLQQLLMGIAALEMPDLRLRTHSASLTDIHRKDGKLRAWCLVPEHRTRGVLQIPSYKNRVVENCGATRGGILLRYQGGEWVELSKDLSLVASGTTPATCTPIISTGGPMLMLGSANVALLWPQWPAGNPKIRKCDAPITTAVCSQDGRFLLLGCEDGSFQVHCPQQPDDTPIVSGRFDAPVVAAWFNSDVTAVFITREGGIHCMRCEPNDNRSIANTAQACVLACSAGGETVCLMSQDSLLRAYSTGGALIWEASPPKKTHCLTFTPATAHSKAIIVAGLEDGTLQMIDAATGKLQGNIRASNIAILWVDVAFGAEFLVCRDSSHLVFLVSRSLIGSGAEARSWPACSHVLTARWNESAKTLETITPEGDLTIIRKNDDSPGGDWRVSQLNKIDGPLNDARFLPGGALITLQREASDASQLWRHCTDGDDGVKSRRLWQGGSLPSSGPCYINAFEASPLGEKYAMASSGVADGRRYYCCGKLGLWFIWPRWASCDHDIDEMALSDRGGVIVITQDRGCGSDRPPARILNCRGRSHVLLNDGWGGGIRGVERGSARGLFGTAISSDGRRILAVDTSHNLWSFSFEPGKPDIQPKGRIELANIVACRLSASGRLCAALQLDMAIRILQFDEHGAVTTIAVVLLSGQAHYFGISETDRCLVILGQNFIQAVSF